MMMRNSLVVFVTLIAGFTTGKAQNPPADVSKMTVDERAAYATKLKAASQEDWQKMMNKLGLKLPSLPPATEDPKRPRNAKPRPNLISLFDEANNRYVRSDWGDWSNYTEADVKTYTLPNPLMMRNGKPVRTAAAWWKYRRNEILKDFQSEIYGFIPSKTPDVTFKVSAPDTAFGGQAIRRTIIGHIDNSAYPKANPIITINLYVPANAKGKVPLMVVVGNNFNAAAQQPIATQLLAEGWAYATFTTGTLQMDSGAGLQEGIIGLVNKGADRQPHQWGVIAAWSWGLSRAMDYLQTDKAIDADKIGLEGHSRWGKTALLAAALDQRWAIVFSSCSGAMGASLEKRNFGETIDNVASPGEYYWMAGNFLKYGGNWNQMPVDAHELMTLIAPRPLFVTGGTQDTWTDPKGEFLACVGASPVYELLGKKGIGATQMPAPDETAIKGDIAFRLHNGGHSDLPDWPVFIQFAKKYFGK